MDRTELVVNGVLELNWVIDDDGFQLDVVVDAGGSDCYGVVGGVVFCFGALAYDNGYFCAVVDSKYLAFPVDMCEFSIYLGVL